MADDDDDTPSCSLRKDWRQNFTVAVAASRIRTVFVELEQRLEDTKMTIATSTTHQFWSGCQAEGVAAATETKTCTICFHFFTNFFLHHQDLKNVV
jgi:hypothetical protein